YFDDFHFDGLRYDEVTVIHWNGGDRFCQDLTGTLRFHRPAAIQIAEYWDWDRAKPVEPGGLRFDAAGDDRLRSAVRAAIGAAAGGASAHVDLRSIQRALERAQGFPASWRSVTHLENHDAVDGDRPDERAIQPRIPALACWGDRRGWYA